MRSSAPPTLSIENLTALRLNASIQSANAIQIFDFHRPSVCPNRRLSIVDAPVGPRQTILDEHETGESRELDEGETAEAAMVLSPDGTHWRFVNGDYAPLAPRAFEIPGSQCRFDLDEIVKLLD